MMHNIGPFHVNGNVLTKHGRTVGEPAMLIMRTEDFCVPVKIGSKGYIFWCLIQQSFQLTRFVQFLMLQ